MENRGKAKYTVLLVTFAILLFVSMVICIGGFSKIARDYKYRSIKGRIEIIERDERMNGPEGIIGTINMDDDYEKEFDYYWEFADMYREYIKGRFADDPSESLSLLKDYEKNCTDEKRKEKVQEYISIIETGK